MIHLLGNQQGIDWLGYYQVNGSKFLQKHLALFESRRTGANLSYHFNDEVFDQYDWTQEPEPEVGLAEFYRRRAQTIRDNNDYVVLAYSGGPDSQNILDTFVDNNIRLDEIVNFNSYARTNVVDNTIHNADYLYNVKPTIERIQKKYGESAMRVTILDEIELVKKTWKEFTAREDYQILFGAMGFPSAPLYRGMWVKHVPHIWKQILDGKRIRVILGADKPNLKVHNNRYCTNFTDIFSCDIATMIQYDPDLRGRNFLEFFYQTPDDPKLLIKQAHTLKRYVESLTDASQFESTSQYFERNHRPHFVCASKQFAGNLKYPNYHRVIYPNWAPDIVTPKEGLLGNRPMDNWWVNKFESSESKIWSHGIIESVKNFSSDMQIKNRNLTAIPLTASKIYYLED